MRDIRASSAASRSWALASISGLGLVIVSLSVGVVVTSVVEHGEQVAQGLGGGPQQPVGSGVRGVVVAGDDRPGEGAVALDVVDLPLHDGAERGDRGLVGEPQTV